MEISDIFESEAFWILTGVGYIAFIIMLFVLKGMEQASIMSWWVKILVAILIPVVSAAFSGYAEG
jgi:hypothetical protein